MTPNPNANLNIDYRSTLNVARVHNATARENPDRLAETRPISLWVALAAIVMASVGAGYFGANASLGYNKFGVNYQPQVPPSDLGTAEGPVDPMEQGAKVYSSVCVNCHQKNGLGVPGQYPPLDGSEWVIGSDERLAGIVAYGLTGPVTVRGQTYASAVMPPHKPPTLSAQKLAYVMSYIRNAWSNKAPLVTPEAVTDYLKRTGERNPFTAAELEQIPVTQMLPGPAGAPAPGPVPAPGGPPVAPASPLDNTGTKNVPPPGQATPLQ
jgi:mono/diheme cytochrome c family protein